MAKWDTGIKGRTDRARTRAGTYITDYLQKTRGYKANSLGQLLSSKLALADSWIRGVDMYASLCITLVIYCSRSGDIIVEHD